MAVTGCGILGEVFPHDLQPESEIFEVRLAKTYVKTFVLPSSIWCPLSLFQFQHELLEDSFDLSSSTFSLVSHLNAWFQQDWRDHQGLFRECLTEFHKYIEQFLEKRTETSRMEMSKWISPSVSHVYLRTEWCTSYSGHGDEQWLYACHRHPTNTRGCWWYSSRFRWSWYYRIDRGICEGKAIRMFSIRPHLSMFTRLSTVANEDNVALRLALHSGHAFVWPSGIDIELRDCDFVPDISTTTKKIISSPDTHVSLPSSSFPRHRSRNMFDQRQRSASTTLFKHRFHSISSISSTHCIYLWWCRDLPDNWRYIEKPMEPASIEL